MKPILTAALSGLIFSVGLAIAGMTDPAKILAFLDVAGDWDPALAFVMGGALSTYSALRFFILKKPKPVLAGAFPRIPQQEIDRRLLFGASIFGVGWGVSGYCPGPAFASLASGAGSLLMFVGAMAGGMALFSVFELRKAPAATAEVPTATS